MGGILKNPLPEGQSSENEESVSEFRKQVYKNTQLNAKLTSKSDPAGAPVGISNLPKDTLSLKHQQDEALKWNQKNLDANEMTKQQFQDIKIDEPKTPYQGAVDPSGEYYKPDEDDDLNNFSLGEPEVNLQDGQEEGSQGSDQQQPYSSPSSSSSSRPLSEEEAKHKRFEEMRKKHYNLKDVLKNRRLQEDQDEDDE
ncbi:hypothetical protein ZYGR_0AI00510 [Zygosaccharomyces rouxii]|uniref:Protein GLC8 n=1 Tax=Zygosaccharomyces rouxii TaxID=4956 RepID=A0A1Q3AAJ7_ZYGRO|nr:hypothetical protein ZYGR_0AI00510 [Zygosaccharomyces rouxii]